MGRAAPESLAAVRSEPPPRVWAPVWAAVRAGGWLLPAIIAMALAVAAAGTVLEALLFRGLFDMARHLRLNGQRIAAFGAVIVFVGGLLALEWPAAFGLLRLGRHLELRLRARFLLKVPRLSDRYFQSRLISDMAFRAHSLQLFRQLPELAGQFVRHAASIVFTAAAIAWFYPGAALPAALAALAAVAVPLAFQPAMVERDLRFREINGALSRFYLDALLGVRAIQAHCAERTLRAAQADQLAQWADYAGILVGLERYDEAETIYRRALKIFEQVYGPEHYEIAANLHDLAAVLAARGEIEEAGRHYRRALEIKEKLLGTDNPDVALTRRNLLQLTPCR